MKQGVFLPENWCACFYWSMKFVSFDGRSRRQRHIHAIVGPLLGRCQSKAWKWQTTSLAAARRVLFGILCNPIRQVAKLGSHFTGDWHRQQRLGGWRDFSRWHHTWRVFSSVCRYECCWHSYADMDCKEHRPKKKRPLYSCYSLSKTEWRKSYCEIWYSIVWCGCCCCP